MWWTLLFASPKTTTRSKPNSLATSFRFRLGSKSSSSNGVEYVVKGEAQVIERLNEALFLELGAVNQYWVHYRLLDDWGFKKLAAKERAESIEEMHHADRLIERIIFLEGHPNLQRVAPLRIGQTIKEVLEADLAGEYDARAAYKASREICEQLGDYVSKNLFEALLTDEEGHIDFLETQLDLLSKIGEEKYGQLNSASADEAE